MTSELKCPFCEYELQENRTTNLCCPICGLVAPTKLWQALIQAKQDLKIAVDALKSAKVRLELINNSKFANLNNVLQIQSQCEVLKIDKALKKIEHKE